MSLPLQTSRLLIREWNILDGAKYLPLSQDDGFNSHSVIDYKLLSQDAAEQKVIEWAIVFGQTKMGVLPIVLKENKEIIGICAIRPIMLGAKKELHFEVMCRLAQVHWGKGYASEVIQSLFQYGFKDLGLQQLIGHIQTDRPPLRKLAEKVGMSFLKSSIYQKEPIEIYYVNPQ